MSVKRSRATGPAPGIYRAIAERAETATRPVGAAIDHIEEAVDRVEAASEPAAREVAGTTAGWLREQPWILTLTKAGWVAKAVVYGAMGWAAVIIAVRWPQASTDGDANYTGIVSMLAGETWSRVLLGVMAAGLLLYVVFRLISILLIDTGDLDAWAHRVGYAVSVVTYLTVAWAALSAALTGQREDGRSSLERYSSDLLTTAPGRLAVGAGAIGALVIAGYFAYKGLARRFVRQLDLTDVAERRRKALTTAGAIGWVGRAVLVAAVAVFLLWAAIQADPNDARGLDRALQEVAFRSTAGTWAVFATGVFLVLYAGFCLASAPYRRVAWSHRCDPDDDNAPASAPR